MNSSRTLSTVTAALAAAVLCAAPASAATRPAGDVDVARADVVSLDGISVGTSPEGRQTATVSLTYSCVGTPVGLLWISLKQPKAGVPHDWDLTTEGTSGLSAAWHSAHLAVPCSKGSRPVPQQASLTFEDEYAGWFVDRPLETGDTFVQLCLTMPAGNNLKALGTGEEPRSSADRSFDVALHYSWYDLTV